MKKQLSKRIISWLLSLSMVLSPACTGLTAIPVFAEESSITESADETPSQSEEQETTITETETQENTQPESEKQENIPTDAEEQETTVTESTITESEEQETTVPETEPQETTITESENQENGDEEQTPYYINNIPVTINENLKVTYYADGTNKVRLSTGDLVAPGNSIVVNLPVNDYIDHKVTINGEEIQMDITGDVISLYANYTVPYGTKSLTIDIEESPWTEEQLSQYAVLRLDNNISMCYYNDYYQYVGPYAVNGDYLAKGCNYYIYYYISDFADNAVLKINGIEQECTPASDYCMKCLFHIPENADYSELHVEVSADKGDVPVEIGDKLLAYYYPPSQDKEDFNVSSGSTVPSEGYLWISAAIADIIDHVIVVNGNELPIASYTPNGDGYLMGEKYWIQDTDTKLSIELVEKKWTEEQLSKYSVFDVSAGLAVFYYNPYSNSISEQANSGDYIHKDTSFVVRSELTPFPENTYLTINGEIVEHIINDDGFAQIWAYEVPDDSDTVRVTFYTPGDAPLSFDEEKISLDYIQDGQGFFAENGDNAEVGTEFTITVHIDNYIDHRLMLNGKEIPLTLSTDCINFIGKYTVTENDSKLDFVLEESPWSAEKLSDYAVIEADENVRVYYYDAKNNTIDYDNPLFNGNYILKNRLISLRIPQYYHPDKTIISINGVQMNYSLNNDDNWQIWGVDVPYNDNILKIEFENEYDTPVTIFADDSICGYTDLEKALANYTNYKSALHIYINDDISVKTLNLPKNASQVTIDGYGSLTYTGTALNIPCYTVIEGDFSAASATVNIAAGKTLVLNGSPKTLGALKGTATSELYAYTDLTVGKISNMGWISAYPCITATDAITGLKEFEGTLRLTNPSAPASITTFYEGELILSESNGKLPKATIANVEYALYLTVENGTDTLVNGTPILYTVKNDYTDKITVTNKTSAGQELNAFLYQKEIRAECADAVSVNDRDFPNLEKALESITSPSMDYVVTLNAPAYVKNLVMPKKAGSITFEGADLTVGNTKLALTANTTINCNIIPDNKNGTLDISAARGTTLILGTDIAFNTVTGTPTTTLIIDNANVNVKTLTSFGNVETLGNSVLTVYGAAKSIVNLDGTLYLTGAKTTAAITNIGDAVIILEEANGILPKTTVTNVNGSLTISVDNAAGTLTNGTTILYTVKNDYTDKITVTNKTSAGQELNAFLYKKEIRAEYAGAVNVNGRDFPNLEKALESITDPSQDYIVTLNDPAYVKNLVMPKKAGSITFEGADLTVGNTKLALTSSTTINCNIIPDNKNGTLDISAAKGSTLTIGTDITLNTVTGTPTTTLVIDNAAAGIKTLTSFGNVKMSEDAVLSVYGAAKSIVNLDGLLYLAGAKTTAAITNIGNAHIVLDNTNGVLPKTTVANVNGSLQVTVDIHTTPLANGTPILYTVKNDYTDKITVTNKTSAGQELNAFLYKKEIRAEYAGAVNVNGRDFPNLEKALESITDPSTDYVVTLNTDAVCTKLTMPKKAKSVIFTSSSGVKTLNIGNTTAITFPYEVIFVNTRVESNKKFKITANSNLVFEGFESDSLTAINGGRNAWLHWDQTYNGNWDITGFNVVDVYPNAVLETGSKFNVNALALWDQDAVFKVNSGSAVTMKYLDGFGEINFTEGFKPITLTGGTAGTCQVSLTGSVKSGDILFTSKGVNVNSLDISGITPDDGVEYGLVNTNGKVQFMGKVLDLEGSRYAFWSEVVTAIERANRPSAEYTVKLLNDCSTGSALKMPKAGTYKKLTITSDNGYDLTFTSALTLTGNTVFDNVDLSSVKNGALVKYTLNAGKYDLTVNNCGLAYVSAINGTGSVDLDSVNVTGTVKAGQLTLSGRNTVTNGITTAGMTFGENAELTMYKNSKITVSNNGISGNNTLVLHIIDKLTGTHSKLTSGTVISASFNGSYNNQIILAEKNGNFDIVLSARKLIAK